MLKKIKKLTEQELRVLMVGLSEQSKDNEAYIEAFIKRGTRNQSLAKYKKIIANALRYDPIYIYEDPDNDYDFGKCDQALKSYLAASMNNLTGYSELLVYTIEQANQITVDYGDMGAGYDEDVEAWYEEAAEIIAHLHDTGSDVIDLIERLRTVYHATGGCHDALEDIYKKHLKHLIEAE